METELLAELIDKKHNVLTQLRRLSQCQLDLIAAGNMTKLMEVLSVKQDLIVALKRLETQLDHFREQDPDKRNWSSQDKREKVRLTAESSESLLSEIMDLEKNCESNLMIRRDRASQQLQGVHSAMQASQAYSKPAAANSSQLDLSSDL